MTDAIAQQLIDGNFTLGWVQRSEQMDLAAAYGLRTRYLLLPDPSVLDNPAQRAQLDALVDRFKACPTAYAYHIVDEPSAGQFAGLARLVDYFHERDPDRMVDINLYPMYATNEQLGNNGYPRCRLQCLAFGFNCWT